MKKMGKAGIPYFFKLLQASSFSVGDDDDDNGDDDDDGVHVYIHGERVHVYIMQSSVERVVSSTREIIL